MNSTDVAEIDGLLEPDFTDHTDSEDMSSFWFRPHLLQVSIQIIGELNRYR